MAAWYCVVLGRVRRLSRRRYGGFNRPNGFVTEVRNHPFKNLPAVTGPRCGSECVLLCQQPFVGNGCERVGLTVAFCTVFDAGVDTVRYVPPSVVAFLACSF
jgi:hypothetical protein